MRACTAVLRPFLRRKDDGTRTSGSIAPSDAPDIAHLVHELGVRIALVLERVENLVYQRDMECVSRSRTQAGPARCCLTLDHGARDVQRVDEVLHSLRCLLARPPERLGALRDRSPCIQERSEGLERTRRKLFLRKFTQQSDHVGRVRKPRPRTRRRHRPQLDTHETHLPHHADLDNATRQTDRHGTDIQNAHPPTPARPQGVGRHIRSGPLTFARSLPSACPQLVIASHRPVTLEPRPPIESVPERTGRDAVIDIPV